MQNYLKKKIGIPCFKDFISVSACSTINHVKLITCFCNLFPLFQVFSSFRFKCISTKFEFFPTFSKAEPVWFLFFFFDIILKCVKYFKPYAYCNFLYNL